MIIQIHKDYNNYITFIREYWFHFYNYGINIILELLYFF